MKKVMQIFEPQKTQKETKAPFTFLSFVPLLCLLWFSFIFVGCGGTTSAQEDKTTKDVETNQTETSKSPLPTIPIYDSFDDLAHIFNHKNDTTYIINFWATWCKPCVEELPYFEDIHRKYSNQPVKVILVSLDFKTHIETKLLPFIKKNKLESEVLSLVDSDANSWIDKVETTWDGAIPVTIVYNKNKRKFIGEQFANHDELESILKTFL